MGIKTNQRLFFYMCVVLKLRGYSQDGYVFDSSNVQIKPLNINTKESEFAPFKIGDRLYYTSSRERRLGVINLDESTERQMLDIYYGDLKDSVTVKNSKPLRNSINNSLNQGTCFFDKHSSKLYYAGNVPSVNKERYKLAIFSTEYKEDKFLKPKIELLLPDTFLASHPMVHNKKLYFSSNLKGGKGRADIYTAELVDGKWANIQNLEQVNSPYDDYFPFVINDREIYFSSNRPGGYGKLDLYKYTFSDGTARIKNLGKPINSRGDDFGLYMDPKQEEGYFSTNRVNNQDDIYHFEKTWPSFNNCVAAIKESYCYDLTDEKSLETDSLKGYFYEWDFGDGTKQKGISVNHCYLQPGNYVINLNIIDVSTKAVFLNQTALDLYVDSIVQLKINALDTMLVNRKVTINTAGTYLPDKKITGYYFEVDNKRIRKSSFDHNFTKLGKHTIKLGIEYEDLLTKTSGLMCTTMEVTCVDSTMWIPYEKRKIDEMVAKFDGKNIQAGSSRLEDLNYDAELAFNQKLGLNKQKMSDKVDDYLRSETTQATIAKINEERSAYGKNIGNNKSGLSDQEEEAFLAFKNQLKQDQANGFNGKNIGNNPYGLSKEEEEAFLAFKNKAKEEQAKADGFNGKNLGNNKSGLTDADEEAYLVFKFKEAQAAGFAGKNIGNNKYGLSDEDESAFLTFKHKQDSIAKADAFNGKNIGGNRYGLLKEDEEAFLAFKNKAKEEQAKADAFNGKNLGNNKSGLSDQEEEALLVFKFKQEQQKADGFNGKNIAGNNGNLSNMDEEASLAFKNRKNGEANLFRGGNLIKGGRMDTLLHVEEKVNITFRVHLGKSKEKKDTSYLSSLGLYGIKEEFVNNEYVYTYKNEKRVSVIEKFYQKALNAGVKDPIVIAYNNNVLIPNQAHHFKKATFEERKKEEKKEVVVKQGVFARLFKKNKKTVDTLVAVKQPVIPDTAVVKEQVAATIKQKPKAPVKQVEPKKVVEHAPDTVITQVAPKYEDVASAGNTPPPEKPTKKEVFFNPIAIKPKDIKIEDLPVPEGENVASARSYADEFLQKYGEATAPDLDFRVQISAFKYRNRYEFPHLSGLGQIENTLTEGGITRITIGGLFNNYKNAFEHNKKVIAAGQKDAFVTIFYKGKRVYLEDLEKMGIFLTK